MIPITPNDVLVQSEPAGAPDVAVAQTAADTAAETAVAPLGLIGTDDAAACSEMACLPPEATR